MFALIETGAKQYKVKQGDRLLIEKIGNEDSKEIKIDTVLMLGDGTPIFGDPYIKGATVTAKILKQTRAPKILIFKKKRRQKYRRTAGHKQHQTFVEITKISPAA